MDFTRGVVHPKRQWPDQPLESVGSAVLVPVPRELTLLLAESVQTYGGEWMVPRIVGYPSGDPRAIQKTVRAVRGNLDGLPGSFSFHDLRQYLASLLIASGTDIKTVQARLRHANATTTLNTYGHLWPDADESTPAAIAAVINKRIRTTADELRTESNSAR